MKAAQKQVLFDNTRLEQPKAEAGRERLAALNPEVRINAHALELRAANVREVFAQYDLVLDGTDRLATRYLINDACVILHKPGCMQRANRRHREGRDPGNIADPSYAAGASPAA